MFAPLGDPILGQPDPVKRAFIEVLAMVVRVDGVIDNRERSFLQRVSRELKLDIDTQVLLDTDVVLDADRTALLEPVAHYTILQGALLAASDGVCHVAEREVLEQVAAELDADAGFVSRALDWALRGASWMEEGMALLTEARGSDHQWPGAPEAPEQAIESP